MLQLPAEFAAAVTAHALAEHPLEACGLVAAHADGRLTRVVPMRNAAAARDCFRFDPREQLAVWRDLEARDEWPRVLYHSHTASAAYPSRDDVAFAAEPQAHYLIVSTADPRRPQLRSFRIVGGQVTEETLSIASPTAPHP